MPFSTIMNTLRFAVLALVLAACGGAVADPSSPMDDTDAVEVESPAAAPDAPSPEYSNDTPEVEAAPAPEVEVEVAPSTPAPSDSRDLIVQRPAANVPPAAEVAPAPETPDTFVDGLTRPSPDTRDDAPEASPEALDDAPEAAPPAPTLEAGDICTADEQCINGRCERLQYAIGSGPLVFVCSLQ